MMVSAPDKSGPLNDSNTRGLLVLRSLRFQTHDKFRPSLQCFTPFFGVAERVVDAGNSLSAAGCVVEDCT